jgi:alpha-tubulin suppressor-like RCC1 family protein
MPTRRNSEIAAPRYRGRPALFAVLIALTIGATPPPASAATTNPGELYAFGSNYFGELSSATNNGTKEPNPTPALVSLPGASGPVSQVAAGGNHSLAVTASGQLYAFGSNYFGELGSEANNKTNNPNPTPALVTLPGVSGPVTQVGAGERHSLALTSTGQLYAFGSNEDGQLGSATNSGTTNPTPTPTLVSLPGASGPVTQVGAGERHSLALTSTGQLYAFGSNEDGQLGSATNSGTANPTPTPTLVSLPGASGPATQVAAGLRHSLALTSTGQLYAFGYNFKGQLGSEANNNPNPIPTPVDLPGASGPVTQVAAGDHHSLAVTSTGQLYAFGENFYGQLGSATNSATELSNPTPALVSLPGASGPVIQVAAGGDHSLALTSGGQLYAFGRNNTGQLGSAPNSGTFNPNPIPTPVDLPAGTTIDTMATGPFATHTLAVIANLAVASSSLPGGRVGARYRATATAQGGTPPYSWQASGLPAGLSIDADGQIRGRPMRAGMSQVALSVSDRFGIVAQSAALALRIARPAISKLRQSHRRWRRGRRLAMVSSVAARRKGKRTLRGTTFTFRLNGRARVRFVFARRMKGRRKGREGKKFRKAGVLVFAGHRGKNRVKFQGRISRRKRLRLGRYRLTATARSGGARSKPRSLRFTIVR